MAKDDSVKGLLAIQPGLSGLARLLLLYCGAAPAEKVLNTSTARWTSILIWKWTARGKMVSFYMLSLSQEPGDEIFKVTVHFRSVRKSLDQTVSVPVL